MIRFIVALLFLVGIYNTVYMNNGFAGGVIISTGILTMLITHIKIRKNFIKYMNLIEIYHISSIFLLLVFQLFVKRFSITLISIISGIIVTSTILLVIIEILKYW